MSSRNSNNTETHRQCNCCKEVKELNSENFTVDSRQLYGFTYKCKICTNNKNATVKRYKTVASLSEEDKVKRRKRGVDYINQESKKAKRRLDKCKYFDKNKGLENDLTIEFVEDCLKKPCIYCGFPSTGVDRLDNKIGHLISNCVPCCKECNMARGDNFSSEEMKIIGQAIKLVKLNRILNIK